MILGAVSGATAVGPEYGAGSIVDGERGLEGRSVIDDEGKHSITVRGLLAMAVDEVVRR